MKVGSSWMDRATSGRYAACHDVPRQFDGKRSIDRLRNAMNKLMKVFAGLTLGLTLGLAWAAPASQENRATLLVKSVNACVLGKNVNIQVRGAVVDIGSPSSERPQHVENSCTYSKFPCIAVTSIEIEVDGNELFVPRSVFADLSDITDIQLGASGKQMLLTLKGGDASEGYAVKVLFSKDQVVKRRLYSALQEPPVQETTYFKTEQLD